MSSGLVHYQSTKRIGTVVSVAAIGLAAYYGPQALLLIPGVWLGHLITPDFDIDHPIYVQRKFIQRTWILGWLWVWYWLPYSRLVSHRSRISHSWPLGTVIRFLYLFLPPYILLLYLGFNFTVDPILVGFLLLGWSIPDWDHLHKDGRLF